MLSPPMMNTPEPARDRLSTLPDDVLRPSRPSFSPEETPTAGGSRRKHPRHPVEVELSLTGESNLYVGFSENLSESGVFFATHAARPVGARIDLSMKLPEGGDPVVAKGEVRWVRPYVSGSDMPPGMGIAFTELSPEAETKLKKFLGDREPLFYDV
jgi:uncharacterized protein (TIGR02266 family)